jgi:tetratricopeptide (TPR) repeat protein
LSLTDFTNFAGMKRLWHILGLGLLLAVMVRCGSSPDSPALTGTTSQSGTAALEALKEIDSLMWKQPDSALTVMLEFAASPEADSLGEFEGHYCQMLISELLYKNDYGQSNREDLLKAVDYFDSIVAADGYKTDSRRDAPRASAKNVQNIAFLDARAHYIDGVGYYEKGDVVDACAEYLQTLEMMEEYFEEKELVGHKARFMSLTYGRLGEIFSKQFMIESAITCYENALAYCKIEPTSPIGVSNFLYRIGQEYDKKNEIDKARQYFGQALECMTDTNNLVYRDIVSSKAVSDYRYGIEIDQPLDKLKQIVLLADNETERIYRYMTIGALFFEGGIFDSALRYLEPVFENKDDIKFQILSANYLRLIYDSIGNQSKSDECTRFLADYKKTEGENKAMVSKLEDMFKDYMIQKQEKEAEEARKKSIRNTIEIIVPIAIVIALTVFIVVKLRSKQLLKQQQEEADRVLGETEQKHEKELRRLQAEAEQRLTDAERKHQQKVEEILKRHEEELKLQKDQSEKEIEKTKMRHVEELEAERNAYQKEREELERSLRQSKENVNALQKELGRKRTGAAEHYAAFLEESVCAKINGLVRDLHITTRKPYSHYHISLDDDTIAQLSEVVTVHYGELKPTLQCLYPGISHEDLLLCYLYLLGLSNKQIAVLRQRDYSTVRKQAKELMGKLRIDETVRDYVLDVAGVEEFVEK